MKNTSIQHSEKILKALANRRRIAIIALLGRKKEASVAEIAGHIELSFKATSKHLNILKNADILENRQESLSVYYRLSDRMPPIAESLIAHLL